VQPQTKHQPDHPVLDEQTFQQLLSAAYVMQEHNARLRKASSSASNSRIPSVSTSSVEVLGPPPEAPPPVPQAPARTACAECGHDVHSGEPFCSYCGAAAGSGPRSALQKSWASLWEMHHSAEPAGTLTEPADAEIEEASTQAAPDASDVELFPEELEEIVGKFGESSAPLDSPSQPPAPPASTQPHRILEETALVPTRPAPIAAAAPSTTASPWTSALKARAWLESLRTEKPGRDWLVHQWEGSRGNIYIVLAALVLLVVVVQWATQPSPQSMAQPRQLSAFEQILVSVGLAEPPPAPDVYHGNPDTKVWVDVRTALYYCPGADLYGKTEGGKTTSQLDAQRDNFQPSTRKPCD